MRALYRIFDRDATLLYVGQSYDPAKRLADHAAEQEWRYDMAYISIEWRGDDTIDADEIRAIRTERPRFNLGDADGLPPLPRRPAEDHTLAAARVDTHRTMLHVAAHLANANGAGSSARDIAKTSGRSYHAVRMALAGMLRDNLITVEHVDRSVLYRLTDDAQARVAPHLPVSA